MASLAETATNCKGNVGHNGGPPIQPGDFQVPDGWVAIARQMRSHWLVGFGQPVKPVDPDRGSYSRAEAWIDLIMECRYEAGTVNNNGKKMRLEQGQVLGATAWLANRWNWTPKTARGFLDRLELDGMISRFAGNPNANATDAKPGNKKGKYATVISVSNYSIYQITDERRGQLERLIEGTLRAGSGQVEGNIYKDNKGTREQGNKGTIAAAGPKPVVKVKKQKTVEVDYKVLSEKLLDACNGALANPVNCQGLLALREPIMWLEEGADLERDILPTLRAIGNREHGKNISSWAYFTRAVRDAMRARLKGLVTFNEEGELETQADRLRRYAAAEEAKLQKRGMPA
jgi:hypothetical protein